MPRDLSDDAARPVAVKAPPRPLGMWGAFRAARRNVLELIPEPAYREPMLASGAGRARWRMVMDPPWVDHVLRARARDYPRSDVTRRLLRPRRGDSLLTADWEDWRWTRRAMTPMFQPRSVTALSPAMTGAAEAMRARLEARAGAVTDVCAEAVAATFDVITQAALSGRERLDRDGIVKGIDQFINTVARVSFLDVLGAPGWIPRPARLFGGGRKLDQAIDAVLAARRARAAAPGAPPDLLDLLMVAQDPETGRTLSPVEQRNNLLALIVAGHETTALALSWALYLLAFDPVVQDRARAEAQDALGGRAATAADLPRLPYVAQVIDEALRLYPPAGFMARTAQAEDEIGGVPVRPGETVMIPVYAIHRHRLLWDDPDAFDPGRFAPDAAAGRHRAAFLPFGAGPRICIGMGFATMEATIILATLLAGLRFALPQGWRPVPRMILTLRPAGGMRLTVERV
jgi:cytochrome P450